MQIKVATSDLSSVLSALAGIKSNAATMELYKCAKLTAAGSVLTVEKANSFISGSGSVDAQIAQPGTITLDLVRLSNIVRAAYGVDKDSELSIAPKAKNRAALAVAGATYALPTLDSEQYPTLPEPDKNMFSLQGDELCWALNSCYEFRSLAGGALGGLTGVKISSTGDGEITFYGAETKKICRVVTQPVQDTPCDPGSILLPGDSIPIIKKVFAGAETVLVETGGDDKVAVFTSSHFVVKARHLEANYPDVDVNLDSLKYENVISVDGKQMLDAINKVSVVFTTKWPSVFMAQMGNMLHIAASDADAGDAMTAIECSQVRGNGSPLAIHVNPLFVEKAVGAVLHRDSSTFIKYGDKTQALCFFTDIDHSLWAVQPLQDTFGNAEALVPGYKDEKA